MRKFLRRPDVPEDHFSALIEHQKSVLFPPVQVFGEIGNPEIETKTDGEESEVNLESLAS